MTTILKRIIGWALAAAIAAVATALFFLIAMRISFFIVNDYDIDPTPCELARYGLQRIDTTYAARLSRGCIGRPPINRIARRLANETSATGILSVMFFVIGLALVVFWSQSAERSDASGGTQESRFE
jgi:preprotein translocase subunit SecG